MKKRLNLKTPETFNEKISYLKLYVYPNNQKIIDCSDKYKVREYVKQKGLEKNLNKLYFVKDKPEDIDWESLPEKFVLKCNHGCGYNIICDDKKTFNIKENIKKLNKWLKEDFGKVSSEPHYTKIEPKIICEEYLGENIKDYKFFCFKGIPKFFYIAQNIKGDFHNMQADFFDADGKLESFYRTDHKHFEKLPDIPDNLDEMLEIAKILSKDFEFVRVDLFNIDGKIYFSELTFSPCSGFMPVKPDEWDRTYGKLIDLEKYKL